MFNFMDPSNKQTALFLWFSVGTAVYLIYLWVDDTDYKLKLKEEQEKEKQEEEWWKKVTEEKKPRKASKQQ